MVIVVAVAVADRIVESVRGSFVVFRRLIPWYEFDHEEQPREFSKQLCGFDNVPLLHNLGFSF